LFLIRLLFGYYEGQVMFIYIIIQVTVGGYYYCQGNRSPLLFMILGTDNSLISWFRGTDHDYFPDMRGWI